MSKNERGAGILLHISSLPSPFGIGDLGKEAYNFADFLIRSKQKYWQFLPVNPTEEGQHHSPYSSTSSMAGNILFISPEILVQEGVMDTHDLPEYILPHDSIIKFNEAERIKKPFFSKAFKAFREGKGAHLQQDFEAYKVREKQWLDDFALYMLIKQLNQGKPWYEWNEDVKQRNIKALLVLEETHSTAIEEIKWLQFIFDRQWNHLKHYCNTNGISLIGDLPFYVSYDSADVWAHRRYFEIDHDGKCIGIAGCPPDSFSGDGQLWGMPVFKWDVLKQENYQWWIDRLKKNKELFDKVRLDHFRAFSAFWNVPAEEQTARNGTWKPGPGEDFFHVLKKALGELPFIAEDLGDIDEPVYKLRDNFQLPGMKILQFAFGGDVGSSSYSPHNFEKNFIVYTGTHDNNTTRGWFVKDANDHARFELEQYTGHSVSATEVSHVVARLAYASVAVIVILPLQDVLSLDESARMNTPASVTGNWEWRLVPGQINNIAEENLKRWTGLYNRQ